MTRVQGGGIEFSTKDLKGNKKEKKSQTVQITVPIHALLSICQQALLFFPQYKEYSVQSGLKAPQKDPPGYFPLASALPTKTTSFEPQSSFQDHESMRDQPQDSRGKHPFRYKFSYTPFTSRLSLPPQDRVTNLHCAFGHFSHARNLAKYAADVHTIARG